MGSGCQNAPCNSSPLPGCAFVSLDAHGCTPDLTLPALPAVSPFVLSARPGDSSPLELWGVLGGPLSGKGRSFWWGAEGSRASGENVGGES